LALDVIGWKAREILGDATGNARLMILLPMAETRKVASDNTVFKAKALSPNFRPALLNR